MISHQRLPLWTVTSPDSRSQGTLNAMGWAGASPSSWALTWVPVMQGDLLQDRQRSNGAVTEPAAEGQEASR